MTRFFYTLLLTAAPAALFAPPWGDAGHRMTGEAAANALPQEMPGFFRAASARLAWLNPEPDHWRDSGERRLDRALDLAFATDHFIDLEMIPVARRASVFRAPSRIAYSDSLRALGVDPGKVGFSPFAIIELTQRLRLEFRRWRAEKNPEVRGWIEQRIIDDAGILGHYVADASNPLHTTVQFNGWIGPNPNGYATDNALHSRFETQFVQAHIQLGDVRPLIAAAPQVFPDIRATVIDYITRSNAETEHLYQLDKKVPFNAQNDSAEHKRFVAERLAVGAQMLRDLWWTAWVTSG